MRIENRRGLSNALVGTALLLLLGVGPAAAEADLDLPREAFVLENGLKVYLVPAAHPADMVSVHVVYAVGARDEAPGNEQLAHLTEHAMFRGSALGGPFEREVGRLGGTYGGSTSADWTEYDAVVPSAALPRLLWLEADRMAALPAGLRPIDVALEREVVRSEGRWRTDQFRSREFHHAWLEATWPEGHPYRRPRAAEYAALDGLDRDDVVGFWEEHYGPQRATLSIVGPFDPAVVRQLVEETFGPVPRRGGQREPLPPPPTEPAAPTEIVQDGGSSTLRLSWVSSPDLLERASLVAWLQLPRDRGEGSIELIDDEAEVRWLYGHQVGAQWSDGQMVATATFRVAPAADPAEVEASLKQWWDGRCAEGFPPDLLPAFEEVRASVAGTASELASSLARGGEDWIELRKQMAGLEADAVCGLAGDLLAFDRAGRFWSHARRSQARDRVEGLGGRSNQLFDDEPRQISSEGPSAGSAAPISVDAVTSFVHRSGARVHLMTDETQARVRLRLLVHGAPLAEKIDGRGLSEFAVTAVEHGKGLQGGLAPVRSGSDDMGAWLDLDASPAQLSLALRDLGSRLRAPAGKEASSYRWGRRAHLRSADLEMDYFAQAKLRRAVLRKHPSQTPVWGSAWSLKEIDLADYRAHLKAWFKPPNYVVLVSGPVTRETVETELDALLGKRRGEPAPTYVPRSAEPPGQPEILLVDNDDSLQTHVLYGSVAPPAGDPLLVPTQVAAMILGGHAGSRMRSLLRGALGSTYGVYARYMPTPGSGFFSMETWVDAASTLEAAELLLVEVDGMRTRLAATEAELAEAKAVLEGKFRTRLGSSGGRIDALQDLLRWGFDPSDPQKWVDAVHAVTIEDVAAAAEHIANVQKMSLVIVAPAEKYEEALGAFGMPVRVLRP